MSFWQATEGDRDPASRAHLEDGRVGQLGQVLKHSLRQALPMHRVGDHARCVDADQSGQQAQGGGRLWGSGG